jgi:hypothetical protein
VRMHLPLVALSRSIDSEVTNSATIELHGQILHRWDGTEDRVLLDFLIDRLWVQPGQATRRALRTFLVSGRQGLLRGRARGSGSTSAGVTSRSSVRVGVGVTNNNRLAIRLTARKGPDSPLIGSSETNPAPMLSVRLLLSAGDKPILLDRALISGDACEVTAERSAEHTLVSYSLR